jgi:hypothetical protein
MLASRIAAQKKTFTVLPWRAFAARRVRAFLAWSVMPRRAYISIYLSDVDKVLCAPNAAALLVGCVDAEYSGSILYAVAQRA